MRVLCASEAVAESFRGLGVAAEAVPMAHKLDVPGAAALWPRLAGRRPRPHAGPPGGPLRAARGPARGARGSSTRCTGCPRRSRRGSAATTRPTRPGVSRARLEWLLHGYLPIEAGLARLGHVVTPSQAMADFMLAHGFPSRALHVIPLGVEAGLGERTATGGRRARRRRGREPRVLEGHRRPARRGPPRPRAACGWRSTGRARCASELERQARESGVDATFHGFVPDLRERLAGLDVLVQPSRADNLPLSVLEAMAAGLPVVGTRVGGIPELVVDGETGILVDPERPGRARARRSTRWPRAPSGGGSSASKGARAGDRAVLAGSDRAADGRALRGAVRILHVIQELGTGGAERILVSAYRGAREAGHEVFVAAAPGPLAAELDAEPYPLPLVQRRPWRIPGATRAVRRAVRDSRPDVVHAHNPVIGLATGLATRRGSATARASSASTAAPTTSGARPCRLVRASGLAPVACGPGVAAALEEHGCTPVATVPNAVGPAPPPADRAELEREWGIAPGTASCSRSGGSSSRRTTRSRSGRWPRFPRRRS